MDKLEKAIKGLECCDSVVGCVKCPYSIGEESTETCDHEMFNDVLELLKGYKELKEQLEELQIIENSRVKDCDDACDWEARNYHKGRFDAYSIALAHFDRKDGDQHEG